MVKQNPTPLITSVPLTAEAREVWLHDLFAEQLGHYGELFIPRDSFYSGKTAASKAQHMLTSLCEWLSIKPGYISLEFEAELEAKSKHYRIYIEKPVAENEFLLAATLAIALTRYWLEEKKQIHLLADEQRTLVAAASVMFGVGLVVANGMEHDHDAANLLGPVTPVEYGSLVHSFLRRRNLPIRVYQAYLTPWAADLLNVKKPRRPSRAVAQSYADERRKRFQLIGVVWLLLVIFGIAGFVVSQRALPEPKTVREAREAMDFSQQLYGTCKSTHDYNRQYADTSDLQTERSLNAEAARCQSLRNEYEAAQTHYNTLSQN